MKTGKERGTDAAKAIADLVNILGGNIEAEDAFVEELTVRTHRTLQQSAGGLLFRCIAEFSERYEKGYYDARNEAFLSACHDLVETCPEHFNRKMPLI